jgi:hypothetical protein
MQKAPTLGSEAKERGGKGTQNYLRARRALENELSRLRDRIRLIYFKDIYVSG